MPNTVSKNRTAVHTWLSDSLVRIYQALAKAHHTSMAHEIEQALWYALKEGQSTQEDEIERREQAILHYVQFLENRSTPPSIRDVHRYLPRYTVAEITEDMTRLVQQGKVEKHRGGKTYRYTVPK